MTVYFDMDGTIADLYSVPQWLEKIDREDVSPFTAAQPLVNMSRLARKLNALQRLGYHVGVISWLPRGASPDYAAAVGVAKRQWLTAHLPSVDFDEVWTVDYGYPKHIVASADSMLFDDDALVRADWSHFGRTALEPSSIWDILNKLLRGED